MPEITFQFTDGVGYRFDLDDVAACRQEMFGRVPDLAERVSATFIITMHAYDERYGLGPAIIQAVRELEIPDSSPRTKAATPFRRLPLKGLWHKHFFDARFLWTNYQVAVTEPERLKLAMEAMESTKSMSLEERAAEMVKRVWSDPLDARLRAGKATGEWVVYLPRNGKNYYLACSPHRKGKQEEQNLLDSILEGCTFDFPDLPKWIEEARVGMPR